MNFEKALKQRDTLWDLKVIMLGEKRRLVESSNKKTNLPEGSYTTVAATMAAQGGGTINISAFISHLGTSSFSMNSHNQLSILPLYSLLLCMTLHVNRCMSSVFLLLFLFLFPFYNFMSSLLVFLRLMLWKWKCWSTEQGRRWMILYEVIGSFKIGIKYIYKKRRY